MADQLLLGFGVAGAIASFVVLAIPSGPERVVTESLVELRMHRSPNRMARLEICALFLSALLKNVLGFLGICPSLKPDKDTPQQFALPLVRAEGLLEIEEKDLQSFRKAVRDEDEEGKAGVVNPFLLVALTVPLLIRILVDEGCPIRPMGSVNTRNVFRWLDAAMCRDAVKLRAASMAKKLSYKADFGGAENPGYRRKRGVEFCIRITIFCDGREILEQEVWSLQFLAKSVKPRFQEASVNREEKAASPTKEDGKTDLPLRMAEQDPKNWAACCKDYNIIHVSTVGAKLFGFPSVIAHGNHTAALAIQDLLLNAATIAPASSAAQQIVWKSNKPFTLEVRFAKPMILPALAVVKWEQSEKRSDGVGFSVVRGEGKVCLVGSVRAAK